MFSLENKKILVTGGTGSMGRTFVDRALDFEDTVALLKKHHLMSEDVNLQNRRELLR